MRVIFLIPGDQTISGAPELATVGGRILVATTPEEAREVPEGWIGLDTEWSGMITVAEWKASLTGESGK